MGKWHLEVTQVALRRYSEGNAQESFTKGKDFDAIVSADIQGTSARLSKMLALPPKFTEADHFEIEQLLRTLGVTQFTAKRHGKECLLPTKRDHKNIDL